MIRPKQKLPFSEKDKEWKKNNLKWANENIKGSIYDTQQLKDLYDLAAGKIKETGYKYITNPLNTNDPRYKNYPAKLRNFDIASPLFSQLTGEQLKRPFEPIVFSKNSDVYNQQQQIEYDGFISSLQQVFVNTLIEQGLYIEGQTDEQGNPINPPLSPDVIKKQKQNVKDLKSIQGQNILDYVIDQQYIPQKLRECWYDFIVTRGCFTYKNVHADNIIYKKVDRDKLFYSSLENVDYIEDAEIVKCINYYTLNEIIDLFKDEDELTDDIIKELEQLSVTGNFGDNFFSVFNKNFYGIQRQDALANGDIATYKFPVAHIQWTSLAITYRVFKNDVFGKGYYIDVDEDYIFDEEEEKIKKWVSEKWEGYIIMDKYYIGCKKLPLQRGTFDNPNKCKNSYNGRIFKKGYGVLTIAEKIEAYQEAYNALKYKIQFLINKNKDKIAIIPIGLLGHLKDSHTVTEIDEDGNQKTTTTEDNESLITKSLYYADATGMLFVDESSENAEKAVQMLKQIDMGLGNYIQYLWQYAEQIKTSAEELIGFNRFRKADTNSSDAVSNVNQGVYAGSLITEEYFQEFNEFCEKEMQGIIDIAKFAFINGKKESFLRSDGDIRFLELEEGSITEEEYGVFVKNGGKTKQDFELLKARALEFAQNGMKHDMIAKIIQSDTNFSKLLSDIETMQDEIEQQQQQQQQTENQLQQMQMETNAKIAKDNLDLEYYKIDRESEVKLEIEYAKLTENALARNENSDLIAIEKLREDQLKRLQENSIKNKELNQKDKELELKNKDIDTKLKIARTNKN